VAQKSKPASFVYFTSSNIDTSSQVF